MHQHRDEEAGHQRKHQVTGLGGGIRADRLKVGWQVVLKHVHGRIGARREDKASEDGPVAQYAGRESGLLSPTLLVISKEGKQHRGCDEQPNDCSTIPRVLRAGPRQREEEGGQRRNEEHVADEIKLDNLLPEGKRRAVLHVNPEGKEDDCQAQCTNREINPETPPPRDAADDEPADRRRRNIRQSLDATQQAHDKRPLAQRHNMHEHIEAPLDGTRRAQPAHGAADDEDHGRRRGGAHQGAEHEDDDAAHERRPQREQRVDPAEHEGEAARAQPERARVPPDVGDGVELVRDGRHGGGHNGHVQADEGQDHGVAEHDQPEADAGWVGRFVFGGDDAGRGPVGWVVFDPQGLNGPSGPGKGRCIVFVTGSF